VPYTVIAWMKGPGYERARILLREGVLHDFNELANDIGRTVLAADMKMHIRTLRRRCNDSGEWAIHELARLSDLLEIDHTILLEMADKLRVVRKKGKL
jgi:hypothetical protein